MTTEAKPAICAHCGEQVEFLKVDYELGADHPYRAEAETSGGWWIHATGTARYLRMCAFGATLADSYSKHLLYKDAVATPKQEAA